MAQYAPSLFFGFLFCDIGTFHIDISFAMSARIEIRLD
jgi:hypothetical protein